VTTVTAGSPAASGRVRAGNAMQRTRTGIVDGARAGIVRDGVRRLSMATVADLGGIAKATVYNHVRSKPELLALVARDLLQRVDAVAAAEPTAELALAAAADAAAHDEVVRAVADHEPAVVGRLLRVQSDPVFDEARFRLAALLERHGVDLAGPAQPVDDAAVDAAAVDVVLRWLLSVAAAPADASLHRAEAALLARALPRVPVTP
jgi:AcrR family transcriptional regulator